MKINYIYFYCSYLSAPSIQPPPTKERKGEPWEDEVDNLVEWSAKLDADEIDEVWPRNGGASNWVTMKRAMDWYIFYLQAKIIDLYIYFFLKIMFIVCSLNRYPLYCFVLIAFHEQLIKHNLLNKCLLFIVWWQKKLHFLNNIYSRVCWYMYKDLLSVE